MPFVFIARHLSSCLFTFRTVGERTVGIRLTPCFYNWSKYYFYPVTEILPSCTKINLYSEDENLWHFRRCKLSWEDSSYRFHFFLIVDSSKVRFPEQISTRDCYWSYSSAKRSSSEMSSSVRVRNIFFAFTGFWLATPSKFTSKTSESNRRGKIGIHIVPRKNGPFYFLDNLNYFPAGNVKW